jgi:ABC-type branched-subunit amino acid transport system ATPase component
MTVSKNIRLSVRGVIKRFGGLGLSDLGVEIEEGRVSRLIGPKGAGKTTSFNMTAENMLVANSREIPLDP